MATALFSSFPSHEIDRKIEEFRTLTQGNLPAFQQFFGMLDGYKSRILPLESFLSEINTFIEPKKEFKKTSFDELLISELQSFIANIHGLVQSIDVISPGISNVMSSQSVSNFQQRMEEWLNKNFQSGAAYSNMRIDEMKTKAGLLLNNLKVSYISEWKDLGIIDELKTSQALANTLISNEANINSAIERAGTLNRFGNDQIEHALKNVAEYFRIKKPEFINSITNGILLYLIKSNEKISLKDYNEKLPIKFVGFSKFIGEVLRRLLINIRRFIGVLLKNIVEFAFWIIYKNFWFFLGLAGGVLIFLLFRFEYETFIEFIKKLPKKDGNIDLTVFNNISSGVLILITSVNILLVSLIGYFIVFCFGNFKRTRNIEEIYKYKSLSIESIGTLYYKGADEKEKALLFPKAIDAIFNQPDFDKGTTEGGIPIPATQLLQNLPKV